ncbi:hypothetical protein BJF79_40935 [Actinomadura sp. CNU-125]|uniref:hypothetical protein n=1 Tax=Actinomadura sp. CNU-125 TaxID=1904961 RepID=UPI000967D881|nr:hypothetical protein [Actinomadura sp. CNU-125]OLT29225.1 hypothetical protein BJF79_40935 [Actinomadura sp. CNU-125]
MAEYEVGGDGNAPGSYTWEDFTEALDLDAMTELGNQWILLGDALHSGDTSFAADVAAFAWTGKAGHTAETTWGNNMTPMIRNAADAAWTVGQSIHAYVEGIKNQAEKMAEEANKQYFTMIFSFLLNVVLLPLGIAASFIGLVARLIGTIVNVITQIGTRMGWLAATAAEFALGAVVGGVTTFGIDMAALGLGTAAAGADWHVDWGHEVVNIGVGAAFGGIPRRRARLGEQPRQGADRHPAAPLGPGRRQRPGQQRPGRLRRLRRRRRRPPGRRRHQARPRAAGPDPAQPHRRHGRPARRPSPREVRSDGVTTASNKSAPVNKTGPADAPVSAPVQRGGGGQETPVGPPPVRRTSDSSVTPVAVPNRHPPGRAPAPPPGDRATPASGGRNSPAVPEPTPLPVRPDRSGSGADGVQATTRPDRPDTSRPNPVPAKLDPDPTPPGRGGSQDSVSTSSPEPTPLPGRPGKAGSDDGSVPVSVQTDEPAPSSRPVSPEPTPTRAPSPVRPDPTPTPDTPVAVRPGGRDEPDPQGTPPPGRGGEGRGGFEVHLDIRRPVDPVPESPFKGPGRTLGDVPVAGRPGEMPASGKPQPNPGDRGDRSSAPPRPGSQTDRITLDFLPSKSGDAPPKSSPGNGTPGRPGGGDAPKVTVTVEKTGGDPPAPPTRTPFDEPGRTLDGGTVPARGDQTVPIRNVPKDGNGQVNVWIEGQEIRVPPGGLGNNKYVVHPGVGKFNIVDGDIRISITTDRPNPAAGPKTDGASPLENPGRRVGDGKPVPPAEQPTTSRPTANEPPPPPTRVEYGQPVTFTFGDRDGAAPTGARPFSGEGKPVGGPKPPARATPGDNAGQAAHDRTGAGGDGPLKSPPAGKQDGTTSGPATTEKPRADGGTNTVLTKKSGGLHSSPPSESGSSSGRGGGTGHRPGGSTVEVGPVQHRTPLPEDGAPLIRLDVGIQEPTPGFARPIGRGGPTPGESAFTGDGRTLGGADRPAAPPPREGTPPGSSGKGGGGRPPAASQGVDERGDDAREGGLVFGEGRFGAREGGRFGACAGGLGEDSCRANPRPYRASPM